MARYTGPTSRIARKFGEPIFGPDKVLAKKSYPPGQHGTQKRRGKQSEYGIQLAEKQKAKYTCILLCGPSVLLGVVKGGLGGILASLRSLSGFLGGLRVSLGGTLRPSGGAPAE